MTFLTERRGTRLWRIPSCILQHGDIGGDSGYLDAPFLRLKNVNAKRRVCTL